jgi:uncharacterized protein (DUF58 family)
MAPTARTVGLVLIAGIAAATVYAVSPGNPLLPLAVAGAVALLLGLDALMLRRAGDGATVTLPDTTRLTVDKDGAITFTVTAGKRATGAALWALELPPELVSEEVAVRCPKLPAEASVELTWPCHPHTRGRYAVTAAYGQTRSLLGLWTIRRKHPVDGEVRVYPNLDWEHAHVAAIFLRRSSLGVHVQRQVGKGREFEKLREYVAGDSFEDIHWKTTAKRGHPVTKEYQIEQTQEVYVVIDASRLSAREVYLEDGPGGGKWQTQLERYIASALVLGRVAEKQHDLFGMATFSDEVGSFMRAGAGRGHHRAIREGLYTLMPKKVNPDFGEICTFLRLRLRRRALVIFLTSLDDQVLAEQFERDVQVLSRHHLVLVQSIQLPGIAPVFEGDAVDAAPEVYERLAGHLQWRHLRQTQQVLKTRGVNLALAENAALTPELVSQYMRVKQRQLL